MSKVAQLSYNNDMGNTVGSRESIAFVARKNQVLWVQPHQMDILIGSILGDAYIAPLGKIQFEHSKTQSDYLLWKYRQLYSISYSGKPACVVHNNQRTGKPYESMRFWTRQFFRPLRSKFYRDKQKVFPPDLRLTPLMVAVWYMDDGHNEAKKNRCILATDNFSKNSIQKIVRAFEKQLSIKTITRPSGKLVISGRDRDRFLSLISQHVIPSMSYKIR